MQNLMICWNRCSAIWEMTGQYLQQHNAFPSFSFEIETEIELSASNTQILTELTEVDTPNNTVVMNPTDITVVSSTTHELDRMFSETHFDFAPDFEMF